MAQVLYKISCESGNLKVEHSVGGTASDDGLVFWRGGGQLGQTGPI